MKIVENEEDLCYYMIIVVKVSLDYLVFIDVYFIGKECEVDVIFDG